MELLRSSMEKSVRWLLSLGNKKNELLKI